MAALVDFRAGFFRCLTGWADATFELCNQTPSHPRPMPTPTRRRRHGHSTSACQWALGACLSRMR